MIPKTVRSGVVAEARASLDALQSRLAAVDAAIAQHFPRYDEPLSQALERFSPYVTVDAVVNAVPNPAMARLVELTFDECNFAVHHLCVCLCARAQSARVASHAYPHAHAYSMVVERWVNLQMPHRESGDNFGADVIFEVLKLLQDRNALVAGMLSDFPNYFLGRASVLEKLTGLTKTTTVARKTKKLAEVVNVPHVGAAAAVSGAAAAANDGEKKRAKVSDGEDAGKQDKQTTTSEQETEQETSVVANKLLEDYRLYLCVTRPRR